MLWKGVRKGLSGSWLSVIHRYIPIEPENQASRVRRAAFKLINPARRTLSIARSTFHKYTLKANKKRGQSFAASASQCYYECQPYSSSVCFTHSAQIISVLGSF